ncbi:MAG: SRPBCC family protein [Anaerolineae bacterium]|nr:SRPBCC family protein [Anaerolineae bacterium]
MSNNKTIVSTAGKQLNMERIFNAPRQLVFEAWSKPEYLARWWGPQGWTLPVCNVDFRVGGSWHYCIRGPEGEESWGKALYHEIVVPERIVYTDYFSDAAGTLSDQMPAATTTMSFIEVDGKTKVTGRSEYPAVADLEKVIQMGMLDGMNESLDRLDAALAALSNA